jgi:hypothetical protein
VASQKLGRKAASGTRIFCCVLGTTLSLYYFRHWLRGRAIETIGKKSKKIVAVTAGLEPTRENPTDPKDSLE